MASRGRHGAISGGVKNTQQLPPRPHSKIPGPTPNGDSGRGGYRPCRHLLQFKAKHGSLPFRAVQRCLTVGPGGRARIAQEGMEAVPGCEACGRASGRLYACLSCALIGCWGPTEPPGGHHAEAHARTSPGHDLAFDIERAELFCCTCGDYAYDAEFDSAVLGAQAVLSSKSRPARHPDNASREPIDATGSDDDEGSRWPRPATKRKRVVEYREWAPSPGEQLALSKGSQLLSNDPTAAVPRGLRGLNNLGNTCFMNSVLQALLHTPPLRNYFLSDRHNRGVCQRRASHNCLSCEMDSMYLEAFSGEHTPLSPARFLYSWWRHAENLAGYEQQDAHEFFISTVDGIHANSGTTSPRARSSQGQGHRAGDADCRCVVHRVFSGLLRSDVICTECGFTSTTYDPCVDISLDFEPVVADQCRAERTVSGDSSTGAVAGKVGGGGCRGFGGGRGNNSGTGLPGGASGVGHDGGDRPSAAAHDRSKRHPSDSVLASLMGCLDRFTRPERLGMSEKIKCQQCQQRQESVKQMSFRKLPLVLCLHIKRFEHSTSRKASRKVNRFVRFPLSLDMTPYLSSTIIRVRNGNRVVLPRGVGATDASRGQTPASVSKGQVAPAAGAMQTRRRAHGSGGGTASSSGGVASASGQEPGICPLYELFAVVMHNGQLDSGHYICFLKVNDSWYKCDDAWVTRVDEGQVRASQAYMVYYVQKTLMYQARDPTPAAVPARSWGAPAGGDAAGMAGAEGRAGVRRGEGGVQQ